MRLLAGLAALSLLLAACGDPPGPTAADDPTSAPGTTPGGKPSTELLVNPSEAPPIVIHAEAGDLTARPGSSCWQSADSGSCKDMAASDPEDLPVAHGDDTLRFAFPVDGWSFQAGFSPAGPGKCERHFSVDAMMVAPGEYEISPSGPAGDYVVSLFGTGPQGDASGEFRWVTDVDGPLPEPRASISIVWDPHGELEGQGFHLELTDLPVQPTTAEATVTATAGNGRSTTFTVSAEDHTPCPSHSMYVQERGSTYADEVAALGPAPFEYDVTLVLDGAIHHATATWPDDHVDDPFNDDPAPVPLVFEPALD